MIPLLVPRPPAPHVLVCAYFSNLRVLQQKARQRPPAVGAHGFPDSPNRDQLGNPVFGAVCQTCQGNGGFLSYLAVAVSGRQWPREASARASSPQRDGSIAPIPVVARPRLPGKFLAQHFDKNRLKLRQLIAGLAGATTPASNEEADRLIFKRVEDIFAKYPIATS
jgi:hypothetical protein